MRTVDGCLAWRPTVLAVPDGSTVEMFGPAGGFNPHLTHPVAGFSVTDLEAASLEVRQAGAEIKPLAGGLLVVPEAVPAGLLVFFHGAGDRAASSLPLVQDVAAARDLLVLLPGSRSRTCDLVLGRIGPDVDALLAEVFAGCDVPRIALGGFSDGGSYALSLGLANGDLAEQVMRPYRASWPRRCASGGRGSGCRTGRRTRCCRWTCAGAGWPRSCAGPGTGSSTSSSTAATW